MTVAECLAGKDYAFEPPPVNPKKPIKVLPVLGFSAALVLTVGLMVATGGRAGGLLWAAGMSPPKN